MVAVCGRAVGADAGAASEAEDVLLVLLVGFVRGAADEEGLRHQAGDPPGHHPHLSLSRDYGSLPLRSPLPGREGRRKEFSRLGLITLLFLGRQLCLPVSLPPSLSLLMELF